MSFESTALAMLTLLFASGAPLGLLILPRRWRAHWPCIAPLAGVALVSCFAWCSVWLDQPISAGVAWWSLGVPCVLAGLVVVRERGRVRGLVVGGLLKHGAVFGLTLLVLFSITRPLTGARLGLTTISLGSCDAADYAAGGSLLRDVPRTDRSGFNGQTETVALHSVDTFHGHWLRLNHFAPAALLAWFSSLFELPMFKLVTALAVALHAAAVPAVFWIARAGIGLGAWSSLAVAACWGSSAPAVYGIGQTALGQIMVVPAVAVLTWAGLAAWRDGGGWSRSLSWAPVAATALVVLIAAYTFALVFVLAPLAASLVWLAWRDRSGMRLLRAAATGAIALGIVGLIFFERLAGLAERFALFRAIDFGWFIPVFSAERWVGWFGDAQLGAGHPVHGWAILAVVGAAFFTYAWREFRRDGRCIGIASIWLVTIAGGYAVLAFKGLREGSNEVYNAYKVFALLQPLTLVALALPLRWARAGATPVALLFGIGLVAVHWFGAAPVRAALRQPALWVDKPTAALAQLEQSQEIASVNMVLEPMWTRLWANSMLLGKRQYFQSHTYEGRRATELRGEWDLRDGLITVSTGDADTIVLNDSFHLTRRAGPGFVHVGLATGWYAREHGGSGSWAWSSGDGAVRLFNPHHLPLYVSLEFQLQGHGHRSIEVSADGREDLLWRGAVTDTPRLSEIVRLELAPGETIVRIRSLEPGTQSPGDARSLSFALHGLRAVVGQSP